MKLLQNNELNLLLSEFGENNLPYFCSLKYRDFIIKVEKKDYFVFYSKTFKALMPVCKYSIKSFPMLQVICPPVTNTGGRLTGELEKQFLNEFIKYVKKEKSGIRVTQSYSYSVFNTVPDNSFFCPFGTYVIDLEKNSEDELFKNIEPNGRNKIRNAKKNNVEIVFNSRVSEDFYTLYKKTMSRSSMYYEPLEHFKELAHYLGENNILCGVSYIDNKPQAGILTPYTGYSAYYLHGATLERMENPGAMDYLQWETIRLFKQKKVKRYDFVGARLSDVKGTKLEGIQNFKKKFGGELIKGYLWKMDIDPIRCKIFDSLRGMNRILKGVKRYKDIIDEELAKKHV